MRTPYLAHYVTPRGNNHPAPTTEKTARDPEAVWTLQNKLSLYTGIRTLISRPWVPIVLRNVSRPSPISLSQYNSNPHLPAVSPYSTQECIAALTSITVTIQFSLPAATRNELAWGIKIPCTSRERSEKLSSIRSDGGNYKDQCLPGCDAV